jgi:hypothetical protein
MFALAIARVVVDAATVAAPSADALSLEWNAPATCPSPARLDEGLRLALREPPREPIRVVAEVVAHGDGFVAEVLVETPWGSSRRHIEASECSAIADTTLLIAVIAADPLAIALGEPAPTVRPEPLPVDDPQQLPEPTVAPIAPIFAPRVTVSPPPRPAPAPAARSRSKPRGIVRLEGTFGLGLVPQPSGAFGGALGVQWRHAELGLTALWFPARTTRPVPSGAFARIGLVTVGPYGCGFLGSPVWSAGLCGSVEVGAMSGQGRDVDQPRTEVRPWFGLSAGPRLRWSPHPRVGLVLGLDGVAVAYRPLFVIANEGDVYRSGIAGFRARLGIEVRWR